MTVDPRAGEVNWIEHCALASAAAKLQASAMARARGECERRATERFALRRTDMSYSLENVVGSSLHSPRDTLFQCEFGSRGSFGPFCVESHDRVVRQSPRAFIGALRNRASAHTKQESGHQRPMTERLQCGAECTLVASPQPAAPSLEPPSKPRLRFRSDLGHWISKPELLLLARGGRMAKWKAVAQRFT